MSIPSQKEKGVEFAQSKEMDYKFFVDEGVSGAKELVEDRPQFAEMLDAIKKGKVNAVYCFDQSRIERNTQVWEIFVALMLNSQCEYYPGGKLFDLNEPENRLVAGITSNVNKFYAALTSKKVKLANELKAKQGKTHGMTPFGYGRDKNGLFKIIEDEAKVVQRIFELSLNGYGGYSIANILNGEGIKTKFNRYEGSIKRIDKYTNVITTFNKKDVSWRGNVIHDMLCNPIYKGIRKWKKIEVHVPAIISTEMWAAVNKNLKENKKNVGKRERYNYLLNGILYCGNCGNEMRGKRNPKHRMLVYMCKGKRFKHMQCKGSRSLNIPRLEAFIVRHLFISKDLLNYLSSVPEDSQETMKVSGMLQSKKKLLTKTIAKIDRAYNLLLDHDFKDDSIVKTELLRAKEDKIRLEEEVLSLEGRLFNQQFESRKQKLIKTASGIYLDSDFNSIKKAIHKIIKRITVNHTPKEKGGTFMFKIEYNHFNARSFFQTNWQLMNWRGVHTTTKVDVASPEAVSTKLKKSKSSSNISFIIIDDEDIFNYN